MPEAGALIRIFVYPYTITKNKGLPGSLLELAALSFIPS